MTARVVDLFAGWGGFSRGAEMAGAEVVWAGNHWPLAVEVHAANHPGAVHACQDLRQADWSALPGYDILLAAPACQGHAQAAQPARKRDPRVAQRHDALRSTAWAVIDAADVTSPRAVIVENVADFLRWRLYPVWRSALEAMGYRVQEHILWAHHLGVPQRRKRLIVTATRGGRVDLSVPNPEPEPAFGPCIEWNRGRWRPVTSGAAGLQRRVSRARSRGRGRRFLGQHVTGHPGVPLHEPIRTITTKDQWFVVDGDRYRPLLGRELARGMGVDDDFHLPEVRRDALIRGLGNMVAPPMGSHAVRRTLEAA